MEAEGMSIPPVDESVAAFDGDALYSRRVVATALGLAAGLVGATWYIGERKGSGSIGTSGADAQRLPKIGQPAPGLVATRAAQETVSLSDFLGRPVWLNFWGSWCQPCRVEIPGMQTAYERLAPRGLVILAVSLDEPLEDALQYAAANGATYVVAGDPVRKGSGAGYAIATFPTHILIDRGGIVREIILEALEEDEFVERAETILTPEPAT